MADQIALKPLLFLSCLSVVFCCSFAPPSHPQNKFCSNDRVIIGKVLEEKFIPGEPDDLGNNTANYRYTVQLVNVIKGYRKSAIGQKRYVFTPGNSALCMVNFDVGTTYYLGGNKRGTGMSMNGHDLFKRIQDVTWQQHIYLTSAGGKYSYRDNCKCQVTSTFTATSCGIPNLTRDEFCYAKTGICIEEDGRCRWFNDNCPLPID